MNAARPLAGRRILLTRRPEQSGVLAGGLRGLGAVVIEVPLIATVRSQEPDVLAALRGLDGYDWIAFTSANAVESVAEALESGGLASVLPASLRVAAVGPSTTEAVSRRFPGAAIAAAPLSDFRAEGLVEALRDADIRGRRVLLPTSDRARDVLSAGLEALGADVRRVVAYRTVTPDHVKSELTRVLARGVDLVVFASPSAVAGFVEAAGAAARPAAAVIGPVTERAARDAGFDVRVVAAPSTAQGLLEAIPGSSWR